MGKHSASFKFGKGIEDAALTTNDFVFSVDNILIHPSALRRKKAEELLTQYEHRVLEYPLATETEPAYKALISLYYKIGQCWEEEKNYAKAIEWFKRSENVIVKSSHLRSESFEDIFLRLSYCYFMQSDFDSSRKYIELHRNQDPSGREACDQLKASVSRVEQLIGEVRDVYHRILAESYARCYDKPIRLTHKAIKVAPHSASLYFNLACFYSLSFKTEEAFHYLEESLKRGFNNLLKVCSERGLENIRSTARFKELCAKYF